MATGQVTRSVLEGYLDCKYLAQLRLAGREGVRSDYEDIVMKLPRTALRDRRSAARTPWGRLHHRAEHLAKRPRQGTPFVLGPEIRDDTFQIQFDALKRVEGHSDLAPLLCSSCLLGSAERSPPASAVAGLARRADRARRETRSVSRRDLPRRPVLRDERSVQLVGTFRRRGDPGPCAHAARRRRPAAPSQPPLRGLRISGRVPREGDRGRQSHASAGSGGERTAALCAPGYRTLTQLSHTSGRGGPASERSRCVTPYPLQALAIRDRTVYVLGKPELPASPIEIFLDVEGKPDEQFVYLIGAIVRRGEKEERHSFGADGKDEERRIFDQLVALLAAHPEALNFAYGAYEHAFIRRMRAGASRKKPVDRILDRLVNALAIVYPHFYFPTYTNGLKEIGTALGCRWHDERASGMQSVAWRLHWERDRDAECKEKLLQYNLDDCGALAAVIAFLRSASRPQDRARNLAAGPAGELKVTPVAELDKARYTLPWTTFDNPDLAFVNKCAHFDYQRQRVHVRGDARLRRRYRDKDPARTASSAEARLCVSRRLDAPSAAPARSTPSLSPPATSERYHAGSAPSTCASRNQV